MSGESEIAAQVAQAQKDAEAKRIGAGESGKPRRKRTDAFPFKVEGGQLWREVKSDGPDGEIRKRWVSFSTEINVLALTRGADGEDWGRLVEVLDPDGKRHRWAMPAALFSGSGEAIRTELFRLGMRLQPGGKAREWLTEYLVLADPAARFHCVQRIGWHGESFILPDETIGGGEGSETVILQSADRIDHAFNVAGSLDEWRESVAARAVGNSRLLLAISAAFAAPLLALTGDDGGGFHFRGASSSGKSTALTVAGSVWGGGGARGYKRSWRATDNGIEGMAAMHNDSCLCIDELSQIDSRSVGAAAYMLGNGVGKSRAGREGQARKAHEWRLLFLSNGEIGLADKIKESGGRIAAGMEVRVIDLRADGGAGLGLFEDLHGSESAAGFAQALTAAAGRYYGTAARAFLADVVSNLAIVRDKVAAWRHIFLDEVLPPGADGQVRRVADRFALVAAAGELATAFGVTGWPDGSALEASRRCFVDWLGERGGIGSSEVADAKARILREIEVNGHSRFLPWHPDPRTVIRTNALGYVHAFNREVENERPPLFYFHASGMAEIMAGLDRKAVLEGLADDGVIVRHEMSRKGKKVHELTKPFKVPSESRAVRLYQVDLAALHGEAASEDA